jgi:hypothetical protein
MTVPSRRALSTTVYCSYMKHRRPCAFVNPMALKQPYSQTFSRMLDVVLTRRRKKAKISAIAPTTSEKMLNRLNADVSASRDTCFSSRTVDWSTKVALIPFAMNPRLWAVMLEDSDTNREPFGTLSEKP